MKIETQWNIIIILLSIIVGIPIGVFWGEIIESLIK